LNKFIFLVRALIAAFGLCTVKGQGKKSFQYAFMSNKKQNPETYIMERPQCSYFEYHAAK